MLHLAPRLVMHAGVVDRGARAGERDDAMSRSSSTAYPLHFRFRMSNNPIVLDLATLSTVTGGTHKEAKPELPPMKGNSTTTGNVVPRGFSGPGWNAAGGGIRGGGGSGASMGIPLGQVRVMR